VKSNSLGPIAHGPAIPERRQAPADSLGSKPGEPPSPLDTFVRTSAPLALIRLIVSFQNADAARQVRESHKDDQGFRIGEDLPLVNGFTADVKPEDVNGLLKAMPKGTRVAVDRELEYSDPLRLPPTKSTNGVAAPPPGLTSDLIGIQKVWDQGFTGKGQTIAIIDSGVHPHPDLKDKIKAWVDLKGGEADPVDTLGHGTHVAGLAAGNGARSAGAIKGTAPDADLVAVRISSVAEAIKGIQWVIENKEKYNISVINMSLGDFATRSYKDDPWAQAAQKAIEAGLVVVVAAGNEGPSNGSVSTPGTNPEVITVGALDDRWTLDRSDDQVADFSSRGPTSIDGLTKPDLLAPGVGILGPLAPGATLDVPELPHVGTDYFGISGTSMATPIVAGLAADLKQANPKLTHHDIKEILVQSADRYLPDEPNAQGAGLVDAREALELALNWPEGRRATPAASQPDTAPATSARPSPKPDEPQQGYLFV